MFYQHRGLNIRPHWTAHNSTDAHKHTDSHTYTHFSPVSYLRHEQTLKHTHYTHHEGPLLLGSLEATVTKLGSCVNELELNGLLRLARCVYQH